jgi:hypothetical protein
MAPLPVDRGYLNPSKPNVYGVGKISTCPKNCCISLKIYIIYETI